ncbi:formate dehydrogenase accessory protein FdhE [Bartonella schoenbuchensis]|uniref:formate dehydrogenase accessory protein FdhE domain-containing protein n=1 Tax=Bartonella schoenbuchensis TaxID=165694 RepID=UPI001ABB32B4|nr:formate dehydrogenase accessory protein FdhE [Bartonella schoenbuchensis]
MLQRNTLLEKKSESNAVHPSPWVKLPDRESLFEKRAHRFMHLATTNPNKEDLLFWAHFCNAQQQLTNTLKDFSTALSRFTMVSTPPFDRSKILNLGFYDSVVHNFLNHISTSALPVKYQEAFNKAQQQQDQWRLWGHNLLNHPLSHQHLAEHIFITGALQIIYCLTSSQLDPQTLTPQQNNLCPACAGTYLVNIVCDWKGEEKPQLCSCLYCGTLWRSAHFQCTVCNAAHSTFHHKYEKDPKNILLDNILIEVCEVCRHEHDDNQFNQHENSPLNVCAHDNEQTHPRFFLENSPSFEAEEL